MFSIFWSSSKISGSLRDKATQVLVAGMQSERSAERREDEETGFSLFD